MFELAANALFGVAIGFLGGFAGIGGAPFLVFLLGAVLGYPQHLAQGTVIAIMLGPMSLPGVVVMWDRVKPNLRYVVIGVLTYALFSYFGAAIAYLFSSSMLRMLFSGLLLLLGLRYIFRGRREAAADAADAAADAPGPAADGALGENAAAPPRAAQDNARAALVPLNSLTMSILGGLIGVVGGLFGIGAGVLMVPLLDRVFGLHKDDARAISLAILLPPVSIGAVIQYEQHGDIHWPMVAVGFAAYFVSNYSGARLGRAATPRGFQLVMGVLLVLSAALCVV